MSSHHDGDGVECRAVVDNGHQTVDVALQVLHEENVYHGLPVESVKRLRVHRVLPLGISVAIAHVTDGVLDVLDDVRMRSRPLKCLGRDCAWPSSKPGLATPDRSACSAGKSQP